MTGTSARMLGHAALGSSAIAVFWMILAAVTPTTNYHLAPLVAVLAAPATVRMMTPGRLQALLRVAIVGVGVIVTIAAAALIHLAGWSLGPSFSPSITPLAELVVVISIGTLLGAVLASVPLGVTPAPQDAAESEATSSRSSSIDH